MARQLLPRLGEGEAVRQEQPHRPLQHRPDPAGVLAQAQAAADSPHQRLLGTHALLLLLSHKK